MSQPTLREVARRRWRIAIGISALMTVQFFGYVLLLLVAKDTADHLLVPGLTVGITLGWLIIVIACVATVLYVRWANRHLDSHIARLGGDRP